MMQTQAFAFAILLALLAEQGTAQQIAQWQATDGFLGDAFGRSVAMDDGLAVVGAPNQFAFGQQRGAAYVIDAATGQVLQRLESDLPSPGAIFGEFVGIDQGLALVAAPGHSGAFTSQGAAYVFDATSGQLVRELQPESPAEFTRFGSAVTLKAGLAIVGRFGDNEAGLRAGAAYVFDASTGALVHKLIASDAQPHARFGRAVASDGERIVVSSLLQSTLNDSDGKVYVFDAASGAELASFSSPGAGTMDNFGYQLAVEGSLTAVSAWADPGVPGSVSTVYLFDTLSGALIGQREPPPLASLAGSFGWSTLIDAGRLFVGSPGSSKAAIGAGAVYVYARGEMVPNAVLLPDPSPFFTRLGSSLAIEGNRLLAGAPANGSGLGSAFLFDVAGLPAGEVLCTGTGCPCGNEDPEAGCANSTGKGAALATYGFATTGADDWQLIGKDMPPGVFSQLAYASGAVSPQPLVDGLLCLGGSVFRLGLPQVTDPSGSLAFGPGIVAESCQATAGCIVSGSTWYFQAWYRDSPQGACGGGSNLTNALAITFAP